MDVVREVGNDGFGSFSLFEYVYEISSLIVALI